MIVVMKSGCRRDEIDEIIKRIHELGLEVNLSHGVERDIIGVLGKVPPELQGMLETLPGIEEIIAISKPYKLASRDFHPRDTIVRIGGVAIGGNKIVVMAGPCAVESEEQLMATARAVKAAGANILRGGAFKPSTSPYQFRGLGKQGLELLSKARELTGLPFITEVMSPEDVDLVASYADILQIGARSMQNFALLDKVGKAKRPVMLKRGLSATIQEWLLAAEYILLQGNDQVILCERGIRTFETYTRNTMDVGAIAAINRLSHLPVIADPSHATGKWYLVPPVSLASISAGAHGLIIEVHPNPDSALKDGAQSLTFDHFQALMTQLKPVAQAVGKELTC
jgi:3-deoxy-7-phosphoheptulonate synthase